MLSSASKCSQQGIANFLNLDTDSKDIQLLDSKHVTGVVGRGAGAVATSRTEAVAAVMVQQWRQWCWLGVERQLLLSFLRVC